MAIDFATVGLSSIILVFYLITIFLLWNLRKKIDEKLKASFTLLITAILALTVRRLQQVFVNSSILSPIPYSTDIVTLIFAMLFFFAILHFYRVVSGVDKKHRASRSSPKPLGLKLLLSALAVLTIVNLLYRFSFITLVDLQPDLLSLIIILFVSLEVGLKSYIHPKRRPDVVGWFGIGILIILFATLIASWSGLTLSFMNTLKQVAEAAVLVFVVIEIFR